MDRRIILRFVSLIIWVLSLIYAAPVFAELMVRQELESGVSAAVRGGKVLFLEVRPPSGSAAQAVLGRYLATPEDWKLYKDRMSVAIPSDRLSPKARRTALESLFPSDCVDAAGWRHTVTYNSESLSALAEWFTGSSANGILIKDRATGRPAKEPLAEGSTLLIPENLLLPVMRTPGRRCDPEQTAAKDTSESGVSAPPIDGGLLAYGTDSQGKYAEYRMRKGESLFSDVVIRFTDYSGFVEVQHACELVAARSSIDDAGKINEGQRVRIPLEMLSDRYQPQGSEGRSEYEEVQAEARRLSVTSVRSKDLAGVVVVLDPGHGGRDQGAADEGTGAYEAEINYDIVCRIKALLEKETRAKVYVTMIDPAQKYTPRDATRFSGYNNAYVQTTPLYRNEDAKVSANLRWYLANDIYRKEREHIISDREVVFTSVHCDALHKNLSGTMIYVPGAAHRRETETPGGFSYASYEEARHAPASSSSSAQRRRDEAISRLFAQAMISSLRRHSPSLAVDDAGDPIRSVIRQKGGRAYLPAVLRNCDIPTKILVETGNLNNAQDRKNLLDPKWRQWFAEAYVDALRAHFGSGVNIAPVEESAPTFVASAKPAPKLAMATTSSRSPEKKKSTATQSTKRSTAKKSSAPATAAKSKKSPPKLSTKSSGKSARNR